MIRSFVLLFLPWLSGLAFANEKPDVVWARTSFPPYFILQGPDADKGIAEQISRAYNEKLTGYNHISAEMSLKRFLEDAKQGRSPICHTALLKNDEREAYIDFSEPTQIAFGNGLILSDAGLEILGIDPASGISEVSPEFLKARGFRVAYQEARSYSKLIDAAIADDTDQDVFHTVEGASTTSAMLKMLASNRLEGVLARPHEAAYLQSVDQNTERLHFLSIGGTAPISLGYFGCAKGEWNDELIAEINRLTQSPEIRQAIDDAILQWLPASLKERYLAEQARYFN